MKNSQAMEKQKREGEEKSVAKKGRGWGKGSPRRARRRRKVVTEGRDHIWGGTKKGRRKQKGRGQNIGNEEGTAVGIRGQGKTRFAKALRGLGIN